MSTHAARLLAAFLIAALAASAAASRHVNFNFPDFPPNDEDPLEYTWRNKEARLQDILRLLKLEEELEEGGVGQGPPLPPPRHRPHYRQPFAISPPDPLLYAASQGESVFAVPPSDQRFYHPAPPPEERAPRTEVSDVEEPSSGGLANGVPRVPVGAEPSRGEAALGPPPESTTEQEDPDEEASPQVFKTPLLDFTATKEDIIFVAVVAGSSAAVVVGVALLGYGWYRLHKSSKAAADVEYPAYGVTGPNRESTPGSGSCGGAPGAATGDRRLAHSAQMYHYQLTKQQIIAMESNRGSGGERRGSLSEADSDDENEEGDYTVYECPGLATTGEMEVKNPLFQDDTTPAIVTGTGNNMAASMAPVPQPPESASLQQHNK